MEEREKTIDKKFKSLTPACYGCVFACTASAVSCIHPLSIRISYDGFTGRSYRFPSFDLCTMNRGMCNFYEPSPQKGAEYGLMMEEKELEAKKKEALDKILDETDDPTVDKKELRGRLRDVIASIKEDDVV